MRIVLFVLRYELAIWRSLARWVARRPAVRRDQQAFGYAGLVSGLIGLWIFASVVEIPLFHVITPWESVRKLLVVVSVWGLAWMLGYYASHRVYPHVVGPDGLRIRHTVLLDAPVAWSDLDAVRAHRREDLSRKIHVEDEGGRRVLVVSVGNRTNIRIELTHPVAVRRLSGTVEFDAIDLYVDDPQAFVAASVELGETARPVG